MNSRSSPVIHLAISLLCAAPLTQGAQLGKEWETLFNGKNLDGWYIFLQKSDRNADPQKVISIEDGAIHAYKDHRNGALVPMGYLGTERSFTNYHLRIKYKWGRKQFEPRYVKKPDGGIYYHHAGPDFVWPQALQCQVEINGVGDLIAVGRTSGTRVDSWVDPKTLSAEWAEFLPEESGGVPFTTKGDRGAYLRKIANHEQDGWNSVEVIVRGDEGAHLVNGRMVNRFKNARRQDPDDPTKWHPLTGGRILLEFEATEMFYRDIEIRMLDASETLDQAIRKVTGSGTKTSAQR